MVGNARPPLHAVGTALVAALAALSCSPASVRSTTPAARVPETWVSTPRPGDDLDSLAFWPERKWLIATAKQTDMLLVFDGATGTLLRTVGSSGTGPGQLDRPNGIAVVGDLVLVVERDNHRIQAFRLPDFDPAGMFGQDTLRRPYGLAVIERGPAFDLFVTDNYETASGESPPDAELGERVKRFRFSTSYGQLVASHVASFGAVTGDGVLRTVESIAVDPDRNRLLIAEEGVRGRGIRVYTVDGAYTGTTIGSSLFGAEPEGIALLTCSAGGYWIATEQRLHRSVFHVLSRENLEHLGSFSGNRAANTDGIAVTPDTVDGRNVGWLFAIDNDRAAAAFSWTEIAMALGLDASCTGSGQAP